MRGGEGTSLGFLPSHSLAISVSEPQKVRKWFLAKVMYQIRYDLLFWIRLCVMSAKIKSYSVTAPESRMPARIWEPDQTSPVVVEGASPSRETTTMS